MTKPSDFFIGVVDFFAILLPGAALVYLFRPFLIDDVPNDWLPTTSTQSWVLFLVLAYIVGHLLHALGSWLLDSYVYGKIYLPLIRPSHARAAKLVDDPSLGNDKDAVKTLLARVCLETKTNATGTNYYDWCLSDIRVTRPAGAAEVDRLQADSKFFRSMVFVFLAAALVNFGATLGSFRPALAIFSISVFALTIFAIWRFCDLRWTATKRVYENYLLSHLTTPQSGDDKCLEMITRTANSGDCEIESKIVQQTLQEIEVLLAKSGDPTFRANNQDRLRRKLKIYSKQISYFKAQCPDTAEARIYEASLYSAQTRASAITLGAMCKSDMHSSQAWDVVKGILAKQQEKNDASQALRLFDEALNICDSAADRFAKACLHYELNQSQEALKELDHIIKNFRHDPLYVSARQFKDEIEDP